MQVGGFDLIYRGNPILMAAQSSLQTFLGCYNNRVRNIFIKSVQLKQLAKVSAFRLRSQTPNTPSAGPEKKVEDEKDKPKKKIFATTLPPKTGAIYKDAYKKKLEREKEEAAMTANVPTKPERVPVAPQPSQPRPAPSGPQQPGRILMIKFLKSPIYSIKNLHHLQSPPPSLRLQSQVSI